MNLSIIIPCFNEEAIIAKTAGAIEAYMTQHCLDVTYELLFVNDGSTDQTKKALDALKTSHIIPVHLPKNQGRGAALRTGIARSKGDLVITLDADLSYDVNHIGDILKTFQENPQTDVVVVSPYLKSGVVKNVPFGRLLLSRFANFILRGFFPAKLSTITSVARGYRGTLVRRIFLVENGKEFHLEILRKVNLYGARIQEISGRLIWDPERAKQKRYKGKNFLDSGKKHFLYGLMIGPTRFFKYVTVLLLGISLYETVVVSWSISENFNTTLHPFSKALWEAIHQAFEHSPHSFFIQIGSLLLGINTFYFLILLHISKMHHEESMRNMLALLEDKIPKG